MKNNFLDKNDHIKEKISVFKAEPSADSYGAIFEKIRGRWTFFDSGMDSGRRQR